jgi:hypothetical protein
LNGLSAKSPSPIDPQLRVWYKDVLEDGLAVEREFLKSEIYGQGRDLHREEVLTGV